VAILAKAGLARVCGTLILAKRWLQAGYKTKEVELWEIK